MNKKTEDVIRNMDIGFMTHPEDYTEDEKLDAFCKAITDYRDSLDPNDYEINPDKLAVYKKACAFFIRQNGYCGDPSILDEIPPFDPCVSISARMTSFVVDKTNQEEFLELLRHASLFALDRRPGDVRGNARNIFQVELNIPDVYVEKEK